MTRSENMARLWKDPEFRARRQTQSSTHMLKLSEKQWRDPKFVSRFISRLLEPQRKGGELCEREKAFVENFARGKDPQEAALASGYSPNIAAAIAQHHLKRAEIQDAISDFVSNVSRETQAPPA